MRKKERKEEEVEGEAGKGWRKRKKTGRTEEAVKEGGKWRKHGHGEEGKTRRR